MEFDPKARRGLARYGPLFFGVGFLAPLFAQGAEAAGFAQVGGFPPIAFGLALGIAWGSLATLRGRWI